ncbi:MAG: hypothetical protein HOC70_07550 [Gammaproteobacteria bacterium]|jgi:hypothetical protein|nr:hypothetical protein [Gammaproteobacteria bacterium]MBT4493084.1 hypothetical protein [Gammaproteobacteria bacterium]MBT7369218.1 hypothetical protein [Gammaproteobacteria bacterium]
MRLLTIFMLFSFSLVALAEKPEWAGNGKPTDEQKAAHRSAMEAKTDDSEEDARERVEEKLKKEKKEKKEKAEKDKAGKQMKQVRNEDKGSEQGKAKREEKSRAWWRFWED